MKFFCEQEHHMTCVTNTVKLESRRITSTECWCDGKPKQKNKQPWRGNSKVQSTYQDIIYMYKYLSLLNVLYYNHQEIKTLKQSFPISIG